MSSALLVTAHPDDECMFFAPTILSLQARGYRIHLLCLSTGNADGLGSVRRQELLHSCSVLGVQRRDVQIVDDPALPDGMTTRWDAHAVAQYVITAVRRVQPQLVITFDAQGVSGHANHVAVHAGVLAAKRTAPSEAAGAAFLTLDTVPLLHKYSSALGALLVWAHHRWRPQADSPEPCFCTRPGLAWRAMRKHHSQFVWFRRLSVLFSRYTFANTLSEL